MNVQFRTTTPFFYQIFVCITIYFVSFVLHATNITLFVISGRPVGDALSAVNSHFAYGTVNFEQCAYFDDPSRYYPCAPGREGTLIYAKTLVTSFSSTDTILRATENVLKAAIEKDPSTVYTVVTNQTVPPVYTVVPSQWRGGKGVLKGMPSVALAQAMFGTNGGGYIGPILQEALLRVSPYDDEIGYRGPKKFLRASHMFQTPTNMLVMDALNLLFCGNGEFESDGWQLLRSGPIAGRRGAGLVIEPAYKARTQEFDRYVQVSSQRPLADALWAVSQDLCRSIGYEDPVLDRNCFTGQDGRPFRTVGSTFRIQYSSSWSFSNIIDVVSNESRIGFSGVALFVDAGAACLLPHRDPIRDQKKPWSPPISTNMIHVVYEGSNALVCVTEICNQLSLCSGRQISISKEAKDILSSRRCSINNQVMPGWLALSVCLRNVSEVLNWRLLHKPALNRYVLDIYDWSNPIGVVGGGPDEPLE
jgi:hypothetical protein